MWRRVSRTAQQVARRLATEAEAPANELEVPANAVGRYSPGDRVIKLSVSGTKFLTLRSTAAHSPVLDAIVEQAENNQDLYNDGAIFIDRDPKHFPVILNHLRSRAEGKEIFAERCRLTMSLKDCRRRHTVVLPKDALELRNLFVEAEHFGLPELSSRILAKQKVAQILSTLSGAAGNPFDVAARLVSTARNLALVGATTLASSLALMQQLRDKSPSEAIDTVKNFALAKQ
ncbi:unnamed protein product [Effrenium voratum]|uniref:Potassium channel tetramerisation-type BTB domain-containing protein n=1 Tax=Effrenium voratum TaxID=2562239 RepID=A0AA36J4Y9_9DINO|nr:unnamed protein product [Effrenium voratum]CAJ1450291.1 unnamed protein product [Effrenium voratum]